MRRARQMGCERIHVYRKCPFLLGRSDSVCGLDFLGGVGGFMIDWEMVDTRATSG